MEERQTLIAHRVRRIRMALARVQTSDWIASVAAFAAIVSLVISVLGYRLASEQTALSRAQFEQSRSFWWVCSVDEDLNLTLTPSRNDAAVESVLVVFPKSLFHNIEKWALKPVGLQLSLQDIHKRLMAIRASEVTFDKATGRYNLHAVRNQLPLIVESRHMVGGLMRSDRSLFFLRIRTSFSMGPTGVDNVKLKSLSLSDAFLYGKLVNDSDDTDEILSRYWDVPGDDVVAQVAADGKIIMEGPFPPRGK
ncbi:MAG: hypothetical protein WCV00_10780 [Verrucomicrobiia bacterium]|jgi:hypothetical protein